MRKDWNTWAYGHWRNDVIVWICRSFAKCTRDCRVSTITFERWFALSTATSTRGHAPLSPGSKTIFLVRAYCQLLEQDISCSTVNSFKNRLNRIRRIKMGFFMDYLVCMALSPHLHQVHLGSGAAAPGKLLCRNGNIVGICASVILMTTPFAHRVNVTLTLTHPNSLAQLSLLSVYPTHWQYLSVSQGVC